MICCFCKREIHYGMFISAGSEQPYHGWLDDHQTDPHVCPTESLEPGEHFPLLPSKLLIRRAIRRLVTLEAQLR